MKYCWAISKSAQKPVDAGLKSVDILEFLKSDGNRRSMDASSNSKQKRLGAVQHKAHLRYNTNLVTVF